MADSLHTFVPNEVINYAQVNNNFSYLLDKIGSSSGMGKYFDNSLSSIFIGDSTSEYSEYGDGTEVKNNIFVGSGCNIKNIKQNNIVIGSGTYKNLEESIFIGKNTLGITNYVADDTVKENTTTIATFGNDNEIKLDYSALICRDTLLLGFENKLSTTADSNDFNSYSTIIGNKHQITDSTTSVLIGYNALLDKGLNCLLLTADGSQQGLTKGSETEIPSNFAVENNIPTVTLSSHNISTYAIGSQISGMWNCRALLLSNKELNTFDITDSVIIANGNARHIDTSIVLNTTTNSSSTYYYNIDRTTILQPGEYSSAIANTQFSNIIGAENSNSSSGSYDGDNDLRTPYDKLSSTDKGKNAIPFIQSLNILGNGNHWSDIGKTTYSDSNNHEDIYTSIIGSTNNINIAQKQEQTFNSNLEIIGNYNSVSYFKNTEIIGNNNYINGDSKKSGIKRTTYFNSVIGNYTSVLDSNCNALIGNKLAANSSKFNVGISVSAINYHTDLGNNSEPYSGNKLALEISNTTQSVIIGSAKVSNSNSITYLGSQTSVPGYYNKTMDYNGKYGSYVLVNSNGKLVYDTGAFYTEEELNALGTWKLASDVSDLITEANKTLVNPTTLTNVNESYILSNKLTATNCSYLFTVGNNNVISSENNSFILSNNSTIQNGNTNLIVGNNITTSGSSTYNNLIYLNSSTIANTSESILIGSNLTTSNNNCIINLCSKNVTYNNGCSSIISIFNTTSNLYLPTGSNKVILLGNHTVKDGGAYHEVMALCEGVTLNGGNVYTYAIGGTNHTIGSGSKFCYTFGSTVHTGASNTSVFLVGNDLTVDAAQSSFIHSMGANNTIRGTLVSNIFALGGQLTVEHSNQFVIGYANDNKSDSLFEIGNGTTTTTNNVKATTCSNLFRITDKGQLLINNDEASVGATRYVTSIATLTTSYGNNGDIAYVINDNNEIASSYTKYNGNWTNIPVGSGGSTYTGPNIVTMTTEQYKTFTDDDKQPNTLYFVTDDNVIEDSGSVTPTPTPSVPTITLSETLTINVSDWNSSSKENKLSITLNADAVNQIIFDIPYYETIAKCGIIPIKEETTGITFKCSEIPSTDITLKILSTVISE